MASSNTCSENGRARRSRGRRRSVDRTGKIGRDSFHSGGLVLFTFPLPGFKPLQGTRTQAPPDALSTGGYSWNRIPSQRDTDGRPAPVGWGDRAPLRVASLEQNKPPLRGT